MAYHLISYDFEQYNFEQFLNEENLKLKEEGKNKGEVYWNYGKRKHKFEEGDICYIYCTNLPDMTKRILLRAKVSDTYCKDPRDSKIECFKICNITPIRLKEVEGKDAKYGYENLKSKYNIKTVQGKQKLDADGKHRILVEDLEQEPRKGTLKEVKTHYDSMTKCVFEGIDHNPKMHKTFTKPNGFNYFETHHIIQQKVLRNSKVSKEIIEDLKNKVYLCPMCHRKIHFSNRENVKKMLDELYKRNKDFLDECAQKVGETDTLKWLYEMYNCKK